MQEQLVSFETADTAFTKGFDERCWNFAWNDNKTIKCCLNKNTFQEFHYQKKFQEENNLFTISIPTQSLLQRWLREEHKIIVLVEVNYFDKKEKWNNFSVTVFFGKIKPLHKTKAFFKTFEEALEEGLQQALKLI